MTQFRPCIDLHEGKVKQIIGGSLREDGLGLRTNHVSESSSECFASRFAEDGLLGGHVIQLGAGNELAARAALESYRGGLQVGGGISRENAEGWLSAGASHVIVTTALFYAEGCFDLAKLEALKRSWA